MTHPTIQVIRPVCRDSILDRSCLYCVYAHLLLSMHCYNITHYCNESTKVQTLGMFLGIDRSMSWKQRCYVSVSYVSM